MQIWRARDAYRVQTLWMALCLLLFGLPVLLLLTSGHVLSAGAIGVAWWLMQSALPRGVRWLIWEMQDGARWAGRWSLSKARRWWHGLVIVLLLGSLLGGCQAISAKTLEVRGCDQTAVTYGYCHMPKQEVKR